MLIAGIVIGLIVAIRKHTFPLRSVTLLVFLCITSTSLAQGPGPHRVTIKMECPCDGVLHVFLVDKNTFKKPMAGVKQKIVRVPKKGDATIVFKGIPAGTYGIRCFLDTTGNGKLDKGLFGPSEPWGMSFQDGKPSTWPRWSQIKFLVPGKGTIQRLVLSS